MTATTMTAPVAPFGAITVHRIVSAVETVLRKMREMNETHRTVMILRSLSASQLDDIGLTRGDIETMARRGF